MSDSLNDLICAAETASQQGNCNMGGLSASEVVKLLRMVEAEVDELKATIAMLEQSNQRLENRAARAESCAQNFMNITDGLMDVVKIMQEQMNDE